MIKSRHPNTIFDRTLATAQLELKETRRWGKRRQKRSRFSKKRRFRFFSGALPLTAFLFLRLSGFQSNLMLTKHSL